MKLDHDKLFTEMLKRKQRLNVSEREIMKQKIVCRSTWHRIQKGFPLMLDTYLRLCDWLEKDVSEFIIKTRRPEYITKRLNKKRPKQL